MSKPRQFLNEAATALLANQSPMPLGIKADLINLYLYREEQKISLTSLFGRKSNNEQNFDLLSKYENRVGYQFDWGMIIEEFDEAQPDSPDDWERNAALKYEIVVEKLLKRYPYPEVLDFIFEAMYGCHPSASTDISSGVGSDHQAVLALYVFGESEVKALRRWMVDVFLPKILPDLFASVESLLAIRDSDPDRFSSLCAQWANGEFGTSQLVLLSPRYEVPIEHFSHHTNLPSYLAKSVGCPAEVLENVSAKSGTAWLDAPIDYASRPTGETYSGPIPTTLGKIAGKAHFSELLFEGPPGYRYQWGNLVEDFTPADLSESPETILEKDNITYTVIPGSMEQDFKFPEDLCHRRDAQLESIFYTMYRSHPLCHPVFEAEEAGLEGGVIAFASDGADDLIELRQWMFNVFLPQILPDLLTKANRLLELSRTDEAQFRLECLSWLPDLQEQDTAVAPVASRF